jgi:hypothetical protein
MFIKYYEGDEIKRGQINLECRIHGRGKKYKVSAKTPGGKRPNTR